MSQGKGISDAVRNTIRDWFDVETTSKVIGRAGLNGYTEFYLRHPQSWARKVRRSMKNSSGMTIGHVRTYRCNNVPASANIELEVQSNLKDDEIQYFVIRVNGKTVDGGVTKVASVFKSAAANKARIVEQKTVGAEIGKTGFRRMTEQELQRMETQVEFDGFASFFDMEDRA